MKKIILSLSIVAALFSTACNEIESVGDPKDFSEGEGLLTISTKVAGLPTTKGESSTTAVTYETQLNNLKVFVFKGDGSLYTTIDSITPSKLTASKKVKYGTYDVYAVANGGAMDLSKIKTLTELKAVKDTLEKQQSTTSSTGFLMVGNSDVTVDGESASVTVNIARQVGRVNLKSVKNNLAENMGLLNVKYAMLINVAGNQNLAGDATISSWYNKAGRKSGSIIASAANADASALTFSSTTATIAKDAVNTAVAAKFYSYKNSDATSPVRLVVVASFGSPEKTYYYPVTIENFAANTTYDVDLTISGEGSDDPDKPVQKGNLSATITVADWTGGKAYSENI